jgi:mitogen-activated protein kinase kinase kinase 7
MSGDVGSIPYIAPEVLFKKGNYYDEMCDVYSFAIILWEVLSRRIPFEEIDNKFSIVFRVVSHDLRPPSIKNCPQVIETLMTRCWSKDPQQRFTMNKVVETLDQILDWIFRYCFDVKEEFG